MGWLPALTRWHRLKIVLARWCLNKVLRPLAQRLHSMIPTSNRTLGDIQSLARLRLSTCKTCPLLTSSGWCNRDKGGCGCYMPIKVQMLAAKCPKGRW